MAIERHPGRSAQEGFGGRNALTELQPAACNSRDDSRGRVDTAHAAVLLICDEDVSGIVSRDVLGNTEGRGGGRNALARRTGSGDGIDDAGRRDDLTYATHYPFRHHDS